MSGHSFLPGVYVCGESLQQMKKTARIPCWKVLLLDLLAVLWWQLRKTLHQLAEPQLGQALFVRNHPVFSVSLTSSNCTLCRNLEIGAWRDHLTCVDHTASTWHISALGIQMTTSVFVSSQCTLKKMKLEVVAGVGEWLIHETWYRTLTGMSTLRSRICTDKRLEKKRTWTSNKWFKDVWFTS